MSCAEGEEARLEALARIVEEKIVEMREGFGEIGATYQVEIKVTGTTGYVYVILGYFGTPHRVNAGSGPVIFNLEYDGNDDLDGIGILPSSDFNGYVDDVSVKKIIPLAAGGAVEEGQIQVLGDDLLPAHHGAGRRPTTAAAP